MRGISDAPWLVDPDVHEPVAAVTGFRIFRDRLREAWYVEGEMD